MNKKIKKESMYLKEDYDIIDKMNELISLDKINLLNKLQIESTLRSRKTTKDSAEETRIFSLVLVVFALIQFTVALFQFLFSVQTSNNQWYGLFLLVTMCVIIYYIFNKFDKLKK